MPYIMIYQGVEKPTFMCGCVAALKLDPFLQPLCPIGACHGRYHNVTHFSSCQLLGQQGKWWREVGVDNFRGGVELAWQTFGGLKKKSKKVA